MNDLITKEFFSPFKLFDDIFQHGELLNLNDVFDNYAAPKFPPTNIYLNDDSKDLTFEFALAGYDKDDIELDFSGDFMEIRVAKKQEKEKEGNRCVRRGIRYSEIKNRYAVPNSKYKQDEAKASFKDGILKIEIPAREEEKKKRVSIDTS